MRLLMTSELLSRNARLDTERVWEHATLSKSYYIKNTFLSFSGRDAKLAPAIIDILGEHGAHICTSKKEARHSSTLDKHAVWELRYTLDRCAKFIYFLTPSSREHLWIPWELGYMDGKIGHANIALFPASDSGSEMTWSEQGYLGIYPRIIWGSFADSLPEWLVYNHHDHTAMTLKEWLR